MKGGAMTGFLTEEEKAALMPSEFLPHRTPVPMQIIGSDEYVPSPQNEKQLEVQARVLGMADEFGAKQGMDRRRFFQSAAGMATCFVAMNEVYGNIFSASRAEASTPEMANARAASLRDQFIMDMHTHFLRDDTRLTGFVDMRAAVGQAGWNRELSSHEQTIEDLKFGNYVKEVFLDSDTKIALISSAPSDIEQDWFLTNEQMAQARERVNKEAGTKRLYAHAIFTPGQPGWLDKLDAALALGPDSAKGYTIGDNTHKDSSRYPWRMDDEKVTYKAYEKIAAAGSKTFASTRDCSRPRSSGDSPTCAASLTSAMWARPRKTGRSSTSSSITAVTAMWAATRPSRSPSSSGPGASPGPATSPTFRSNTGSTTSTPM